VSIEAPGGSPTARGTPESPGPLAARAVARLAKVMELALAEVDLSLPQFRTLVFLDEVDEPAASALAGNLRVSRPSVTALVDGLVARGLVERRPGDADRRRVGVVITSAGRRALREADRAVECMLAGILIHLPEPSARRALDGLCLWHEASNRARDANLARAPR
jgi:long-chain acyl-CoA synthetase